MGAARFSCRHLGALCAAVLLAAPACAAGQAGADEVAPAFARTTPAFDHVEREAMIPMRDGVRLRTVIVAPRNRDAAAPIILTRTPYGADARFDRSSPRAAMIVHRADEPLLRAGYIRVYQDIRGRYGSEGGYVMNLPVRGPLNPGKVDQATDAWDTIDWLVKNVPGNNGRVGLTGVSYAGWTTLMGLIDPHPALKAAVPMFPMVDGWIGDDFYHNGALRQTMFEWIYNMATSRDAAHVVPFGYRDLYAAYLDAGSAEDFARRYGADRLATWRKVVDHPAYDAFWRGQAVHEMLAGRALRLPVMVVHGLFDQEDGFGGIAVYRALTAHPGNRGLVSLVAGPWSHGQSVRDGSTLGAFKWNSDTGLFFREEVLQPFWDRHLKHGADAPLLAQTLVFDTGLRKWNGPVSSLDGAATLRLYLAAGGSLSSIPAAVRGPVSYVSDPAKPVPYRVRPILPMQHRDSSWERWLVDDQRPFADRPDVLTFETGPLDRAVTLRGSAVARLLASTSGSDADWIVKIIDVFPPEVRSEPELGGYQLMVAGEIFRGRYRESLSTPRPLRPGQSLPYEIRLPFASHTFLPGHRIMVQIQSSWFPLYDRNPQHFVASVAQARAQDYRVATHRIVVGGADGSVIELPISSP